MESIIFWASLGILVLALLIGLGVGLIRGVKRSAIHLVFLVVSLIVAFLLTKTITQAILGIRLPIDNGKYTISEYIIYRISKKLDISSFDSASTFVANLPNAIVAPILFILVSLVAYLLFDIAYLITARLVFGKKKEDFKDGKPYRAFGGVLGLVEAFFVVVMMFGPLSSLTGTYKEIVYASSISRSVPSGEMKTVAQYAQKVVPQTVDEIVVFWDKSVLGKLPKMFGLNNFLFDNLSSFKVNGEKIVFRKEVTNFAYMYDDFVEVYNLAKRKEYSSIHMGDLKTSLNYVLDGNLFEVVVCDTIEKFVVDYEELKTKLKLDTPEILDKIVAEIKTTFEKKGFDAAKYLKQDIKNLVNAVDLVFTNDLISGYNNIQNKNDFIEILEFINANNDAIKTISNKFLSMNIIEDSFVALVEEASKAVEKVFEGKDHHVSLNPNLADKSATVRGLLSAVDNLLELNKDLKISELLKTDNIVETLTSVKNISLTMEKAGNVFDKLRNLEILVVPPKQEGEKVTYVFDNILKNYGIDLLGDEVYLTTNATEKTVLDTYKKFFTFIAGPIDVAKEMGITDFGKEGVTFDSIFDRILISLKILDEEALTRVVMPFYQLSAMDLRNLVFEKVIENLKNNVGILSLDEVIALDDYKIWVEEFNYIGSTLNLLNSGKGEIEGYDNTYIKYLLSGSSDLEKMMKAMLDNDRLAGVLDKVFSARVFKKLTGDVFDILDNNVKELTGTTTVEFSTDWKTKLTDDTKANTIETIEGILKLILSDKELTISDYGKILNLLKINASNGGQKDGVFNNIFMNVIWYLTGDDLTEGEVFAGITPHEDAKQIKAFLNISDYYAESVDYETRMAEAEKVINLAKKFEENVNFAGPASSIADGIATSLDGIAEDEKVKIINDLDTLLKNQNKTLLDENVSAEDKADLDSAISSKFGSDSEISLALKELLGL